MAPGIAGRFLIIPRTANALVPQALEAETLMIPFAVKLLLK
jgi:hypothetical protein